MAGVSGLSDLAAFVEARLRERGEVVIRGNDLAWALAHPKLYPDVLRRAAAEDSGHPEFRPEWAA